MTKKQERAERRIQRAKERKQEHLYSFVLKVARRRLNDPQRHLVQGFHCLPHNLEMPREEFLSMGRQLVGGAAVLFDEGELKKLLPNWQCERSGRPTVLLATYVRGHYQEDGRRRDTYSDGASSTSGSSLNW